MNDGEPLSFEDFRRKYLAPPAVCFGGPLDGKTYPPNARELEVCGLWGTEFYALVGVGGLGYIWLFQGARADA